MERNRYSTDLTDKQWQQIEKLMPSAKHGRTGRPRKYSKREMLNSLLLKCHCILFRDLSP